jgi:hypothetical protein
MVSTDAILVYGFQIEEGSDDEERCQEFLDVDEEAWEKLEEHDVELVEHCSNESPMFILALADVGQRANRGSPEKLKIGEIASLDRTKSDAVLAKGAKVLGITPKAGEWLLCSHLDPAS